MAKTSFETLGLHERKARHSARAVHQMRLILLAVSEIEAVNVLFIKDERRAEPHLVIGDFGLTEPSGSQFFVAPLERARYQSVGRINR